MKPLFKPSKWKADGDDALQFRPLKNKPDLVKKVTKSKKRKNKKAGPVGSLAKAVQDDHNEVEMKDASLLKVSGGGVTKPTAPSAGAAQLRKKLQDTLKGGRFRFLNEQLYTMNSNSAKELFAGDQDAFGAYHDGYRSQVEKWPMNPLDKIIKSIKKMRKDFVIGDFGCGEGKLSQSVPNKVFSIDLVSSRDDIIASDMANTPLTSKSLDVAVYCLSLMGTNLNDYLLEANRVLKLNGTLHIAEISSRFENVYQFTKSFELCGFKLVKKDTDRKLFYFFQFKKVQNVDKDVKLPAFSLKPCMYRKR